MKIYEAPNLPRGEKLPDYVEMSVKTIFAELAGLYDKQDGQFMVSVVENAHDKIWVGTKCLMYQAIESIAEKAYVLATKNIEEKDGLYVTNGNRMKLNELKDGLQRIPADKKKERFEFLIQQIFRGAGFGLNVSLTTIIDAFNQDQSFNIENSIVQTYLAEQDKKTGKFPNADKLIYKLIEKHRTEINLENVLTPENALVLPPVFIKTKSGKPKKYRYKVREGFPNEEEISVQVFQLTRPEDLELETYLQDICIGDDSQGYKKSLVDGSMIFFSVSVLLPKARTLEHQIKTVIGSDDIEDTVYYSQSTNPEIKQIKTRRHPEVTISAYVSGKNISFDQFKQYRDLLLDKESANIKLATVFLNQILPDLCKQLESEGYNIKGFGTDLSNHVESGKVYVLGKGNVPLSEIKEGDKIITNGMITIPRDISKEQLQFLCTQDLELEISEILGEEELMGAFVDCKAEINCTTSDDVVLPNLRHAKLINLPYSSKILLPSLQDVDTPFSDTNSFAYVKELDLGSFKKIKGDLRMDDLEVANFDSLEEVTGTISLRKRKNIDKNKFWDFPKLKKVSSIDNITSATCYNMPELTEAETIFTCADEMRLPKLTKLRRLQVVYSSIELPSLETVSDKLEVKIAGPDNKENFSVGLPRLIKCPIVQVNCNDRLNLSLDVSSFDFSTLDLSGKEFYLPRNVKYIVKSPEELRQMLHDSQERPTWSVVPPIENFFRSKGEYLVKTGKYWGQQ